jgi:antitoxin component of MazEF toxin-antitoxin module
MSISLGSYPSAVNKSGKSYRTTIPLPIAKALNLDNQDSINWELKIDERQLPFVIVTFLEKYQAENE